MNTILNKIDEDISLLLDNLPVGIIRLDANKRCVYANKFIMTALGTQNVSDVFKAYTTHIHSDDLNSELHHCNDFIYKNIESESVLRLYNDCTSEYRWMVNKRALLKTKDNASISYMYTLQDVHSNKLLEIQLRNETLKAEKACNHKSLFLANMSHEIRTPLNGIIGMLTLLEDTTLTTEQFDFISMIKECSFNLMTIINDILDYSKLEIGKISLDVKPMNLQECIESTNDIIVSKIYEKSLEYSYTVSPDIVDYIHGDSNRIKQVLLNLLSNAIKFTDKGNIHLNVALLTLSEYTALKKLHHKNDTPRTTIVQEFDSKNPIVFLRFDVKDTGCGIDTIDTNKLFKSFSQVDNQITSKVYQGTGLGLAISKELVELMDGFIWLDWSEPTKGSQFSFVIKVDMANEEVLSENDSDAILKNANVLIVDDNVYNRISLVGMITKWGMKPYAFSNGEEALYFTKLTKFDIGLIDICMPKFDGVKFASKLREQVENNNTFPLIALSSLGDKHTADSKYFRNHLIKPIKESKLKRICIESLNTYYKASPLIHSNKKETNVFDDMSISILDNYLCANDISGIRNNIRILLAEDVYINQKVIVNFLAKLGFTNCQVVENGQQCLDYVYKYQYDIVLLDIRMPIMNGETVLKHIQEYYAEKSTLRIPYIIAVTAYCLKDDKEKYLEMGFNDYVPKPISFAVLKECMDKCLKFLLNE